MISGCASADDSQDTDVDAINRIFNDPKAPAWSSHLLDSLTGRDRNGLVQVLRAIDRNIGDQDEPVTQVQANLLRDVSVHNFSAGRSRVGGSDLDWLVDAFRNHKTQVRAILLASLVSLEDLPTAVAKSVMQLAPDELWA